MCDDILSFLGLGEAFGSSKAWDDFGTFRSSLKCKVDLSNPEAWDEIDASVGELTGTLIVALPHPIIIGCSRVFPFRYNGQFCFAVSVDALVRSNSLPSKTIKVGQVLVIPESG